MAEMSSGNTVYAQKRKLLTANWLVYEPHSHLQELFHRGALIEQTLHDNVPTIPHGHICWQVHTSFVLAAQRHEQDALEQNP